MTLPMDRCSSASAPSPEDDMPWTCRTVHHYCGCSPRLQAAAGLSQTSAAASSTGYIELPRPLPAIIYLRQLISSEACAGEVLPQGMTVYSNAVHGLSASTSGQGSSAAGPLEMSLPRMERETMSLPPGVGASPLSYSLPSTEGLRPDRKGVDSLSIMSLPQFDWGWLVL